MIYKSNCIDAWKSRLRMGSHPDKGEVGPHKCAAIFIDNSGVDVILGILPFAEHLLSRGTEVRSLIHDIRIVK